MSLWRIAFRASMLFGLLAVGLNLRSSPIAAAPTEQAAAPEALRCPGRTLPSPPERWRWEWQWEVLDGYRLGGTVAEDDGPYAVALDRQCNLYVADAPNKRVLKLNPDGAVIATWPAPRGAAGESSSPRGIAVDAQGNIYISDTPRDVVLKLSPSGTVLATWGMRLAFSPEFVLRPEAARALHWPPGHRGRWGRQRLCGRGRG